MRRAAKAVLRLFVRIRPNVLRSLKREDWRCAEERSCFRWRQGHYWIPCWAFGQVSKPFCDFTYFFGFLCVQDCSGIENALCLRPQFGWIGLLYRKSVTLWRVIYWELMLWLFRWELFRYSNWFALKFFGLPTFFFLSSFEVFYWKYLRSLVSFAKVNQFNL